MSSRAGARLSTVAVSSFLLASLMTLPAANAVHTTGLFELDGNAIATGSAAGDDWSTLFPTNGSSTVFNASWVAEPASADTTYFSVASKDINDISTWSVAGNSAPPKDEIVNAFAAAYNSTTHGLNIYFGADRWANNGDAAVGFWFLQDGFSVAANGSVTGTHVTNDTLIVSHFTNGGAVATIYVYRWDWGAEDHLVLLASGQDCVTVAAGDLACGRVNSAQVPSAVPYQGSGTKDPADQYPARSFFEGGINLTALYGGSAPCFSRFVAETRSSQETTATLKDIAYGAFNNCPVVPPQSAIAIDKVPLAPIVDLGQPIGFGMTIVNSGPDPAESLLLWDDMPNVTGAWSLGGANATDCGIIALNLTCDFGTVAVEDGSGIGTRYIEVTAGTSATTDCGPQNNTAFITANDGLANDQSSASVYVWCSDVGVAKSAAASAIDLGGNVTYTLVVTSYGPDAALNVTLVDTLPDVAGVWELSGANASECILTGDALSCDLGTLDVGASDTITATASTAGAGDCGWQNNTATVSARVDTDGANNASSASTYVRCSDVGVDKTAADADVYLGTNATFTIVVTSGGPDAATNVSLTDTLPEPPGGWEIVSSDATCGIAAGVLGCDFGDIPAGETRSVTVTAATTDATTTCGEILNTATVGADVDLDAANDSDSATVFVRCSDVSIQKTAAALAVDVGTTASFTITVHSEGPDTAINVTVTDTLPSTANAWTLGGDNATDCGIASGTLGCSFGDVPAGQDRVVTLTTTTTLADCGPIENSATASADVDISLSDNTDGASVYVTCADVGVEKSAGSATIDVGQNATFTLLVTSYGPDAAENVTLADTLPSISGGWSLGGADAASCTLVGDALACDFGTLASGATRTVALTGTPGLDDCGAIDNEATVSARLDTNASNDADGASIYVTCADVGVQKDAADGTIDVGGTAEFGITVTSYGPDAAENVTLSDTLPAVDGGWTLGGADASDCGLTGHALACDFGTLASGATRSITLTATPALDDCGLLENTATVAARLDTNGSNDQDGASIYVTCADVGVQKDALDATIDVGENATFDIVLTSYGPDAAENVTLSDTLPAIAGSWSLGGDDATDCGLTGLSLACDFGTVPAGATRSIRVTAATALDDCGALDNTATVGARLDTNASNNEDGASIYVTCADVGVQKSATDTSIDVGGTAEFSIVVTSYGPDAAEDVGLTDTLPALAGGWTLGGDNATDCGLTGLSLTCSFGTVPAGATRSITLTGATGLDDCGLLDNTATATARLDTNASNDADGASIYVTCADVQLNKTTPGDVDVGTTATFDIVVTSLGPDAATNVVLTDTLPALAGGWTLGGDNATDCGLTGYALTCSFGTIPAGGTRSIQLTGATALADCGDVTNGALVRADVDTDGGNNASTATLHVTCADVGVQKSADDGTIDVGSNASFSIVVTSYGPDTAENVTLADTLPALAGGWTLGGADAGDCGLVGLALTCDFGDIPSAGTRTVTLTGATALDDCGLLENTASVLARLDTNGTNNASSASVYVTCADVGVQKSASQTAIDVGENASFTITVTSYGPDDAEQVVLNDTLPALAGGWTLGGDDAADCSLVGLALTCDFGTVADGATRSITLTGATALDDCGALPNWATVGARLDTNGSNDVDDASIYVTCSDVGIAKTAYDAAIDVGENATFTLTLTSNGPDAADNATLDDVLPGGISWAFVAGSDEGSCSITDGSLTCDFGTVPAGQTRSVTVTGTTGLGACDGVANEVSAAAALDTNGSNNGATAFIDVTCADVTVEKSANLSQVVIGQNFTWSITIRSLGPDAATNVTLTDATAGGTVLGFAGNASAYCGAPSANISCSIPTLGAGGYVVLEVLTSSAGAACGPLNNTATVGAAVNTNTSNDGSTASIDVSCPYTTRTQGFWSAHTNYTQRVFDQALGGTMTVGTGGHTRVIDDDGKLFGSWLSSIPYKTTGQKRSQIDSTRMVLLQQLTTAKLNCAAFGCSNATISLLAAADAAYAGSNKALMANVTALLDAYNNGGDWLALPPTYGSWNPATPDVSRIIANRVFWDAP